MKSNKLTPFRLLTIAVIFIGATTAWSILGNSISMRTTGLSSSSGNSVSHIWGPSQEQVQPVAWYLSPTGEKGIRKIQPSLSDVEVSLNYVPKKKGLIWHRTYDVHFNGSYEISNPTPIDQTIYVNFKLPSNEASYQNFSFELGEKSAQRQTPRGNNITQATTIPSGESATLKVSYQTRGTNEWKYLLSHASRLQNFKLTLKTNFPDIDFPEGTGSPGEREQNPDDGGWSLLWDYPDVIHPQSIGMAMPKALNAGPVAARISYFAPISLLFFFSVLIILGAVKGMNLHPVNYFFIAAGFFAFQLLFAYLVDLFPLHLSFMIASLTSVILVIGYLRTIGGKALVKIALPAQIAYLILFSYSFFFDGLSGITITIGAVATLALLMINTAKTDWGLLFHRDPGPSS